VEPESLVDDRGVTIDLGPQVRGNEGDAADTRPSPLAACAGAQRTDVARELAAAISGGGLSLEYQPLVDLRTYRVDGMEALARWWVPSEGWRPPDRWIPVAEERGLIIPFGRWALSTVLQQIAVLRSRGHGRIPVAVNLSPLQLDDLGFVDFLREELQRHGVSAADLDLELTEHHFRMSSERLRPALESLRTLGCRVHLDDYGTGDSSLQSVFQLPIDAIKIDRAFVRGLPTDPASAAIVDSTVMMAHRMGLRVIAEGVETLEQVDYLRQIGCDLAQGFIFSRPIPQQALSDTLAAWDEHVEQFREESVESSVPAWRAGKVERGLLRGMRIVAVDDEPGTLSIAEAVLTDAGATVYATHSVADAIARVAIERPDVVISDLQMPGLSGWEFIKLLHHDAPGLAVVVVSGYIDERMRAMHQPDGVVSKPYRASTLVNTVRQVVESRAARATSGTGVTDTDD